jgi:hypothetical protein
VWESVLPEAALRMPAELARVDELLDDPVFLVPFRPFFSLFFGRPSIPMETFLRMMWLKYRYVRHEAPNGRVGCKDPPSGCRSSPMKRGAA